MGRQKVVRLIGSVGKTRTLELEDGSVVVRAEGSVSWRNNNPGNLKFEYEGSADRSVRSTRSREQALADAQKRYAGVVGLDQWGNAVFESYEAGRTAKIELLARRHGDKTVEGMLRGYSVADYSGQTHHAEQAAFIYREGHRQGVELKGKTIAEMSPAERESLADGIRKFEGWFEGRTQATGPSAPAPTSHHPAQAIYREIDLHFFQSGREYEYGRPDLPKAGRDRSRLERDLDGDGRYGVDCSAFVWRGLKNAGFDVPGESAAAFTTRTLFNGRTMTAFAEKNFEVIPAGQARRPEGDLQPGDILLFGGQWQHVGVFKEYDDRGRIVFVGSQSSTGPNEVTINPGRYWDGGELTIVGALRARPEFQVRAPLHGDAGLSQTSGPAVVDRVHELAQLRQRLSAIAGIDDDVPTPDRLIDGMPAYLRPGRPSPGRAPGATAVAADDDVPKAAFEDGLFNAGDRGVGVRMLQVRLNTLGHVGRDGRPLEDDARFGPDTAHAVRSFQRANGLEPTGAANIEMLRRVEQALSGQDGRLARHDDDSGRAAHAPDVRSADAGPHALSGTTRTHAPETDQWHRTRGAQSAATGREGAYEAMTGFDPRQPMAGHDAPSGDSRDGTTAVPVRAHSFGAGLAPVTSWPAHEGMQGQAQARGQGPREASPHDAHGAGMFAHRDDRPQRLADDRARAVRHDAAPGADAAATDHGEYATAAVEAMRAPVRLPHARGASASKPQDHEVSASSHVPVERDAHRPGPAMSDSAHPAHAMYVQAQCALCNVGASAGLGGLTQHEKDTLSASVVAQALSAKGWNFTGVDHVVPTQRMDPQTGRPESLFVVQGDLASPSHQRISVNVEQALSQTIEQSSDVAQSMQLSRAESLELEQSRAEAMDMDGPKGPMMRMGSRSALAPPDPGIGDGGE